VAGGSERATFVLVWLACLTLLAATVGVSRLDLGPWNVVLNLTIAAAKAGLIVWFYMELREDRPLVRIFAIGGLFWVAILFGLGLSDWLTRGPW
jgi:cytochrome c oxidase subunit IV